MRVLEKVFSTCQDCAAESSRGISALPGLTWLRNGRVHHEREIPVQYILAGEKSCEQVGASVAESESDNGVAHCGRIHRVAACRHHYVLLAIDLIGYRY